MHIVLTESQTIKRLAGEALPESDNTRSSIISHLDACLARKNELRVSPGMANAITANCDQKLTFAPAQHSP